MSKYFLPDLVFQGKEIKPLEMIMLLRTMIRIRQFEEKLADLVLEGKVITPCHLYTGQEAVATGVCYALRKDDYLFGNHRSHGHFIAKGGNIKAAMAEIFGKVTGCSKGRGGSMHLCDPKIGILGTSSIVAGTMAVAVGTALAESIRGTGRVTVQFHGDGVPEEGIWHEAANFAALNRLPIVFICENNLYCTHMPLDRRRVADNISDIARDHGFKTFSADGNNVLDVYHNALEAVDLARHGDGPCFIECRTYRWRGHVGPNDDIDLGLRNQAELSAWKQRCPIKSFGQFLIKTGVISENELDRLNKEVNAEIDEAILYAIKSSYPDSEELNRYVFREEVL